MSVDKVNGQALGERLTAWGYGAGELAAEAAGLELACRRAEAYVRQFCGLDSESDSEKAEDWPQDMQDVLLELAGVYFLRGKLGLAGETDLAGVSSLKLGDVSVSLAAVGSGQDRTSGWLESVEQSCRERLVGYRKIKF